MASVMLADRMVSATDLKRRGVASLEEGGDHPMAIMKNNNATHYVLRADVYAQVLAKLDEAEDAELNRIADARMKEPRRRVSLADL